MVTHDMPLNVPEPFTLHIDDELLDTTHKKLQLARYPVELEHLDEEDWRDGAPVKRVKELTEYWKNQYNWRKQEASINAHFKQYKVKIEVPDYGHLTLHYAHHPSSSPNAIPLLFLSGWPGSFLEARDLIQPLTTPSDSSAQAFHLVVASIPGFGPGEPATRAFDCETAARAFKILMVDVLHYTKFVTHGGDFGSFITRMMAHAYHEHVRACHTNFITLAPPPVYKSPLVFGRLILNRLLYTKEEQASLQRMMKFRKESMGYIHIQSTKPQTLGFGLGDSPIGLLAWLVEKFHGWCDIENFTMSNDDIITAVMMHWIWGATPGLRMYKSSVGEGKNVLWPYMDWSDVPYGYSEFPKEVASPPLDWIRPGVNLRWHKKHEKGGHFAAMEQPELLIGDLREWFGSEEVKAAMSSRVRSKL